jgi:hypothetical protein
MLKSQIKIAFVFVILSGGIKGQMDSVAQAEVIRRIESLDNVRNFIQILDSAEKYIPLNFSVPKFKGKLYAYKADALGKIHDSISRQKFITDDESNYTDIKLLDRIDSFYRAAAQICRECRLNYILQKMRYESNYNHQLQSDIDTLKKYGWKRDYQGFWLAAEGFAGNNIWVGVEASFTYRQPRYKLGEKINGKKHIANSSPQITASLFNIGYRKNVSGKGWGMNISPVSFGTFNINARPANFTYLSDGTNGTPGYCPEIGFSIWHIYVHYGYNIAFKRSMKNFEGHLINLKWNFFVINTDKD